MIKLIARDSYDTDMFHVYYRWPSKVKAGYLQKLAFTIHVDDIEGIFGKFFYRKLEDMEGDMFIDLEGEILDD